MRLLFEKGRQRELLKKEKEERGLTWKIFADELGMRLGKLMTFFTEERVIDDLTFNKLNLRGKYQKFIIKRLGDKWGQSLGGKNSFGNLKRIKIPIKDDKLAELFGIVLGDGNVQSTKGEKIGVYNVRVVGHSVDDRNYLLYFVKPLFESLFDSSARIYESKTNRALNVSMDSKEVVNFFEENGFKSGNKIVNQIGIPNWIKDNDEFLASCLRGLFDTDGSFYRLTNQNSYQVHFKNHNKKLLKDVRDGLISLGIIPSKIVCGKSIVITKKSEIQKFYKLIGFSNSKHLNKIQRAFGAL